MSNDRITFSTTALAHPHATVVAVYLACVFFRRVWSFHSSLPQRKCSNDFLFHYPCPPPHPHAAGVAVHPALVPLIRLNLLISFTTFYDLSFITLIFWNPFYVQIGQRARLRCFTLWETFAMEPVQSGCKTTSNILIDQLHHVKAF